MVMFNGIMLECLRARARARGGARARLGLGTSHLFIGWSVTLRRLKMY